MTNWEMYIKLDTLMDNICKQYKLSNKQWDLYLEIRNDLIKKYNIDRQENNESIK